MLRNLLSKREEGFTLIEIVFVLAIAALIIVIVFLAIAGARNSAQDQARKDWAGRVSAACDKWAGDTNNGNTSGCAAAAVAVVATAGNPPNVGGTTLTASNGAASATNASIGATSVTILLNSGVTYTATF